MNLSALVAGLGVGLVVGLTGSGGGALLTPILILFLRVGTKTAVASDLVASLIMRPVAGAWHLGQHRISWPIVGWLLLGSIPAAFVAGWASQLLPGSAATALLRPAIGVTLILSGCVGLVTRLRRAARPDAGAPAARVQLRPAATLAVGVVGGIAVGLTSVGSGTLVLVALGVLYPALTPAALVGTDLVQAVPLVAAATLGHLLAGGVHLSLTTSVVLGGVVGASVGSLVAGRISSRALGGIVAVVLFASGCALVGAIPGAVTGAVAGVLAVAVAVQARRTPLAEKDDAGELVASAT